MQKCRVALREGLIWNKKNVWNFGNCFFTHKLKHILVKILFKRIYFFTYKPRKLYITKFSPNKSKNFDFQVKGYHPPHTKKNFLCRFAWLRTWKKKIKKSVKMAQFCPDPPPSVKFHTFFFSSETFPKKRGKKVQRQKSF